MIILGAIGIVVAGIGAYNYATRNGAPTCDGQTMEHGDICEVTSHGVTTNKTYEDMQSDSAVGGIIMLVIGGLLIVGAGFGAVRINRNKKAVVAGSMPYVPGQPFPPQYGAGYPAQPGQPGQPGQQFAPPQGFATPNGQPAPYGQAPYGQAPYGQAPYGQPQYPAQPSQYPPPPPPGQYPPNPGQYPPPPGQFAPPNPGQAPPPPGQYPQYPPAV